MTIRRRKTPAPKRYRVFFSRLWDRKMLQSLDGPGVFNTRAAALNALRSAKSPEKIKAFRYRVSVLRASRS